VDPKLSPKMEANVLACLKDCDASAAPYDVVAEYLDNMKASPNWTETEMGEFQTRVLRALLGRARKGDAPGE
jgi:hypothetical protein